MNEFGPYFGDSAISYDASRRCRRWAMGSRSGLQGYAAYLNGSEAPVSPGAAGVIAAEMSAMADPNSWLRPVVIGVVTSAAAFIVNRWLERTFFK